MDGTKGTPANHFAPRECVRYEFTPRDRLALKAKEIPTNGDSIVASNGGGITTPLKGERLIGFNLIVYVDVDVVIILLLWFEPVQLQRQTVQIVAEQRPHADDR